MSLHPDTCTNCTRCAESLDRGYSSRWKGETCLEVICFKCDKKESLNAFMRTNIITTHFMMDCMLAVYRMLSDQPGKPGRYIDPHNEDELNKLMSLNLTDTQRTQVQVQIATARICNKIKEFETKVWFKGLQDMILAEKKERGISAHLGKKHKNFCVLTWTGMGRTMITIEDDDASVTCVADETSKESRTGFHGIRATGEQALALYDKAISLYEDGTLKFKIDKKIGLF